MIVPHTDERPAGASILQIRIEQISAIQSAIVIHRVWHVKVSDLFAVRVTNNVAQPPRVIPLRAILRVPNHLVDKVAEMKDKPQLIVFCLALILPDHSAISVRCASLNVLATDESKADGSTVL